MSDGYIGRKSGAAGGWGSLKAVAQHIVRSGASAKSAKALAKLNQDRGFDCPGCAWGDPEHGSSFEFCENGVKAVAWEATSARADPAFFAAHTVSDLKTWDGHALEKAGRLTHPMLYDAASDHYRPIGWDAAFQLIANELKALPSPNEAAFYTSGRASNEAAFLYQIMVRAFGTNNLPDCSNMCHEASGIALTEQIGIGKGTVRLEDFDKADAIFVWGQNPGSNHPRMLATLRDAAKRGAAIVALNPLKERGLESFADPKSPKDMVGGGVDLASHYLSPRPGGDMAVALGMVKALLTDHWEVLDHSFIDIYTEGLAGLDALAASTPWAKIEQQSGLTQSDIETLATIFAKAERVIFTWAMGLTQHEHSVPMIQMLVNVLLLGGQIGKPGAGACPVRGHSNVQGDRTMGINEAPPEAFLEALENTLDFTVPRAHGVNTVQCIQGMECGEIKAFVGLGGNFAAATPDSARTEIAIEGLDLIVNIATKPNRSHLMTGKTTLVLPCLGRTEIDEQADGPQFITVEDSMSMVHGSAGMNKPAASTLKSEPSIVAGMAHALLGAQPVDWLGLVDDYDRIR
ncbi:MAG: FdhF/YdeP family oxidoreductase, partial [Alphaproteobacteria bacterium]